MKNKQLNYPYCIASAASAHIVRQRIPPASKARQRVPMPNPLKGKNLSSEIQR